jgi:hypothetical protein
VPFRAGERRASRHLPRGRDASRTGAVAAQDRLVYEDRGRWRSDLEVHFGEPIEVDDWVDLYRTDSAKAVRAVTDLLADRLAEATVNHGSRDEAELIDRAAAFALADTPRPRRGPGYARRNELRRALATSIAIAGGETSEEYRELGAAVEAHVADLAAIGARGRDPRTLIPTSRAERLAVDVELAALSGPALLGIVANAPTVAVVALAAWSVRNEAWKATTIGVIGTFLSPALWAAEYVVLARRFGRRRALALTAAGAAGGAAAVAWREGHGRRRQIRWRDAVGANEPELLARAEASRAALRERVAALIGPETTAKVHERSEIPLDGR